MVRTQQGCPPWVLFLWVWLVWVFSQWWLILNLSSLVYFKRKCRTIRDLLSQCLTTSNKNSPFSLAASSVLGHLYNFFSSSVSKSTGLPCPHQCCSGGCSMTLLLRELQAFCNYNAFPVLNFLTASLYAFVLVPELPFQLNSFSLPTLKLCRHFSSEKPPLLCLSQGACLVPGERGFGVKGYSLKQGYFVLGGFYANGWKESWLPLTHGSSPHRRCAS